MLIRFFRNFFYGYSILSVEENVFLINELICVWRLKLVKLVVY